MDAGRITIFAMFYNTLPDSLNVLQRPAAQKQADPLSMVAMEGSRAIFAMSIFVSSIWPYAENEGVASELLNAINDSKSVCP